MNDLLENPNYFYCEKLHCKLKLQVCLGRQKANAQRKSLEPLPFPECSQCGQGERNKPLISGKPEQGNPQSGQGRRYEDCDLYEDCLDHAVTEDWENFHCEACPLNQSKEEKPTMTESPKPENARICEDCKERPTMRPNFPLCASCMAKRSNKPRAPSTKKRKEKKTKPEYQDKGRGEKSSPGGDQKLVVDFREYPAVLKKAKELAIEQVRPIDLEIIYLVKVALQKEV